VAEERSFKRDVGLGYKSILHLVVEDPADVLDQLGHFHHPVPALLEQRRHRVEPDDVGADLHGDVVGLGGLTQHGDAALERLVEHFQSIFPARKCNLEHKDDKDDDNINNSSRSNSRDPTKLLPP
jgi:hypothetical protein